MFEARGIACACAGIDSTSFDFITVATAVTALTTSPSSPMSARTRLGVGARAVALRDGRRRVGGRQIRARVAPSLAVILVGLESGFLRPPLRDPVGGKLEIVVVGHP